MDLKLQFQETELQSRVASSSLHTFKCHWFQRKASMKAHYRLHLKLFNYHLVKKQRDVKRSASSVVACNKHNQLVYVSISQLQRKNIFVWNWFNTVNIKSVLWILMAWCFSTRASVATVLSMCHTFPAVYGLMVYCIEIIVQLSLTKEMLHHYH